MPYVRREIDLFLTALSFMTRFGRASLCDVEMLSQSVRYFGLVGFAVGAVQTACAACAVHFLPNIPLAGGWAWLCAGFWATRGLHWDAVSDMGDALGSGAEGEKFRSILKDSRMGAFGGMSLLLTFSCVLLCAGSLCGQKAWAVLLCAPAWGRSLGVVLAAAAHSASGKGLGSMACSGASPLCGVVHCAAAVLLSCICFTWHISVLLCAAGGLLVWYLRKTGMRHGGVNGDFLGACMQWGECCALAAACL